MTTNNPTSSNEIHEEFAYFDGPGINLLNKITNTQTDESDESVVADLSNAGISFELMNDEVAEAITEARQLSLEENPLVAVAQGLLGPVKVPQPLPSKEFPGHSYVSSSRPSVEQAPSLVETATVSFIKRGAQRIAEGRIGKAFGRLCQRIHRLGDPNTEQLRKMHPLAGAFTSMTDADLPEHLRKVSN